jgi:hypothetical protein
VAHPSTTPHCFGYAWPCPALPLSRPASTSTLAPTKEHCDPPILPAYPQFSPPTTLHHTTPHRTR